MDNDKSKKNNVILKLFYLKNKHEVKDADHELYNFIIHHELKYLAQREKAFKNNDNVLFAGIGIMCILASRIGLRLLSNSKYGK